MAECISKSEVVVTIIQSYEENICNFEISSESLLSLKAGKTATVSNDCERATNFPTFKSLEFV